MSCRWGSYPACLGMPFSSARGPAIPSLGNPAHVRNRRPTCETAGSHAGHVGTQVTVAHSQSITDHGAATHRPAMQHSQERGKHHHLQQQLSHATKPKSHPASNTMCPAFGLYDMSCCCGSHLACLGMPFSSARGPAIPNLGNPAHVRNRRPTCETAGSHAGHVGTQVTVAHSQSMTDHGAATHRPAMQHSQERGKHHHLQQRLSRAAQPTSHHPSNTTCPASKLASTN